MKNKQNIEKQSALGEALRAEGMEQREWGEKQLEGSEFRVQSSKFRACPDDSGRTGSEFKVQSVKFLARRSEITRCLSVDGQLPQRRITKIDVFEAHSLRLAANCYNRKISTVNHSKRPRSGFLPLSFFSVRKRTGIKAFTFLMNWQREFADYAL